MSIKDQALKSKMKYSQQALTLLDQIKEDDFDIEEFEKFCEDNFFIIGSTFIIDYLTFRQLQKQKANKKRLCNPQK
jgi:hypothetical protein